MKRTGGLAGLKQPRGRRVVEMTGGKAKGGAGGARGRSGGSKKRRHRTKRLHSSTSRRLGRPATKEASGVKAAVLACVERLTDKTALNQGHKTPLVPGGLFAVRNTNDAGDELPALLMVSEDDNRVTSWHVGSAKPRHTRTAVVDEEGVTHHPRVSCVAPEQSDGLGVPQTVQGGRTLPQEFLPRRIVVGTEAIEGRAFVIVYELTSPDDAEPEWQPARPDPADATAEAVLAVHDDVTNVCLVQGVVYFGTRGNSVARWHWMEDTEAYHLLFPDCMPHTGTAQLRLAHNSLFVGYAGLSLQVWDLERHMRSEAAAIEERRLRMEQADREQEERLEAARLREEQDAAAKKKRWGGLAAILARPGSTPRTPRHTGADGEEAKGWAKVRMGLDEAHERGGGRGGLRSVFGSHNRLRPPPRGDDGDDDATAESESGASVADADADGAE
uniref:Uncharacterized protein n=1 Tax=Bicosoecida sp. CB-2014 TaxID=1486930 RepID=A0A7S1CDH5_9STRA|mmetsp:Transcript_20947/g.73893  ORF Transcript_20947/g.73893 Transcript_20947/m.73893 type:complete len:444 (+) Transcript_20947:169-1500(+)